MAQTTGCSVDGLGFGRQNCRFGAGHESLGTRV